MKRNKLREIETYLEQRLELDPLLAWKLFKTFNLSTNISLLNKEYRDLNSSFRIDSRPVEGENYRRYFMVRI